LFICDFVPSAIEDGFYLRDLGIDAKLLIVSQIVNSFGKVLILDLIQRGIQPIWFILQTEKLAMSSQSSFSKMILPHICSPVPEKLRNSFAFSGLIINISLL